MTIVILHPGQIVYTIEGFEIVEATVVRVESKKQITLCSEFTSYQERQKTYGVNFFITEKKATKVLKEKLEKYKEFKNTRSVEANKNNAVAKVDDKRKVEESIQVRNEICNSCGLPVGRFSHCGCSH